MKRIIIDLNQQETHDTTGGATLNEKTVNIRDWDASVIEGCCTQNCC